MCDSVIQVCPPLPNLYSSCFQPVFLPYLLEFTECALNNKTRNSNFIPLFEKTNAWFKDEQNVTVVGLIVFDVVILINVIYITSTFLPMSILLIKRSVLSWPFLDFMNLLETKSFMLIYQKTLKTKVCWKRSNMDSIQF